jgi:hypothetical protein
MKVKAFGLLRYVAGLGLALALFAVSPAIRVADPFGSALAADSPPAVAQPVPAANNPSSPGAPAPAGPTVPAGPQAPAMGADANILGPSRITATVMSTPASGCAIPSARCSGVVSSRKAATRRRTSDRWIWSA